jgi:uncharacterized protein
MSSTAIQPIQQSQRTAIIDMLRGWALLGVVLMNYIDYLYLGLDFNNWKPDILARVLQIIGQIVFAAKSWTMLSFLFGYGFAVLMNNVSAKGINAVKFFSRRMFWLFVLAIINSAFFFGDILKDYAVMGLVLLIFWRCSARVAFLISISLLLMTGVVAAYISSLGMPNGMKSLEPHLHLYQSHNPLNVLWFGLVGTYKFEIVNLQYLITVHFPMLSMFFLGLAAQKMDFFNRLAENKKYVKRIFWISLASVLLLIGLFILTSIMKWNWMKYYQPGFFIVIGSMLFIASAVSWLYVAGKLKRFFRSMQTIGKMTLTNYIVQNIIGIFLFSGFGLGFGLAHKLHFGYYLLFALTIYVLQIYFSKWWLSHYLYGPIEWVWRQLSYAKKLPIRKNRQVNEVPMELSSEPPVKPLSA